MIEDTEHLKVLYSTLAPADSLAEDRMLGWKSQKALPLCFLIQSYC
jgi:hypothetical protein